MVHKILRLPDVIERVGFSRSSIYAFVDIGTFPKPVKIGIRAVGWLDSDVDDWISGRIEKSHGVCHSRKCREPDSQTVSAPLSNTSQY